MLLPLAAIATLLFTVGAAAAETARGAASAHLPRPAGLEPNVLFWTRIYTEVDTRGGLIHDSEYLDVVYEEVRFPEGLSDRARERRVEKAKDRYRAILRKLASGRRSGLSAAEQRVLGHWPEGTTNATFRRAAQRLRFQLGQADKFRAGVIRSGIWLGYIEQTLREYDVPIELAALPHVESSFNPRAYSRVGAAGLWQFTRPTGRRYMKIDSVIDERMDPWKATVAAARLLRDNQRRLQAWPLAITAYNHGVSGMARAVRKLGTRDIATISRRYKSRSFGFASRNFYAEFVAASQIHQAPERYFGPIRPQQPYEYATVVTDHYYTANSLARAAGVDLEVLRDHNLALRSPVWDGNKFVPKGYELRLPLYELRAPVTSILARIPSNERIAAQKRDRFHTVRRGDTISKIATRYRVSERELVAVNHLRSRHRIRVGQVLRLPVGAGGPAPAALVARSEPPADGLYRVRRGDTLSSISSRFGVTIRELAQLNGLRNRHRIRVGQKLRVAPEPVVVATADVPGERAASPPPGETLAPRAIPPAPPADEAAPQEPEPPASPEVVQPEIVVASVDVPAARPDPEPREPVTPVAAPEDASADEIERDSSDDTPALDPGEAQLVAEEAGTVLLSEEAEARLADSGASSAGEVSVPAAPPLATALAEPQPDPPEIGGEASGGPDPANYAVSKGRWITVQADETLGHYAEWLEVRASHLRLLNNMRYSTPLVIGRRKRLDFSRVPPEVFEQRRLAYHRTLQEEFFDNYVVNGTDTYVLRPGDTVWGISRQKYEIPMWLLRQYNPDVDFGALHAGSEMVIPRVAPRTDTRSG
jgi:membrane-bound lytic murein transglycosylase D